MDSTSNSDIQEALAGAMAARPYTHKQDVDDGITAVITVEEDIRYLPSTLRSLFAQSVLPGTIVIADATGRTGQPVRTGFEVIPSPEGPVLQVPESKHVDIQIVRAKGARSFADAVSKALDYAVLGASTRALWLLHDDSRPSDGFCLERLLEAWRNTPGADVLGCKQCDWEGGKLHDVGMYAGRHAVHSLVVDGEPDQEQYDWRQDVFAVSLAGALVSYAQLARLRGINPWFTTYGESVDFCRRVVQSGGRVVVVPSAEIAHRRARYEGVRTRGGQPLNDDHAVNPAMAVARAQQRYLYTDIAMSRWPLVWLWRLLRSIVMALAMLFGKKPYQACVELCMPWLALTSIPGAVRSRRLVARQTRVSSADVQKLAVDRKQIAQYHDRRQAFLDSQGRVLLSPLERSHLRSRAIRRWSLAMAMALACFLAVMAWQWPVFRGVFSTGSLYSDALLPTGASFRQLAQSATTPWVFGAGTGEPAPPTPWLLVLLAASVLTFGHVPAALALIYFCSAPLSALSFWALAGIFTRSDAVRLLGGMLWVSLGVMFGWYSDANLPMLTELVFLPAAFAFAFRAVGMYHTEDPLSPRTSVQAAALSALCFIPVVAAQPQLLLALIVVFLCFLVFVRRNRMALLLIPVPAAFAVAPTIMNAIRYAHEGAWRQLFGDIMLPDPSTNGKPEALNLLSTAGRALGWQPGADRLVDTVVVALFVLVVLLSIASLVLPFALRASRLMWVTVVCGALVAMASSRVAVAVGNDGVVAGSAQPGILLMVLGLFSCVCLVAGGAVKRFQPLHTSADDPEPHHDRWRLFIVMGRSLLAVLLAGCVAMQCWYGLSRYASGNLGVSGSGLPMVASDYLASGEDHRILAIRADTRNTVEYTVMRTSKGDLIDSSPAQRVRALTGEPDGTAKTIAKVCATLLSNPDAEAVAAISSLGFGGIYVVPDASAKGTDVPFEQLSANIEASEGTQMLVSTESGNYYRLTLNNAASQHVDTSWQRRTQQSAWRYAWIACLGVVMVLYCLVAMPRRRMIGLEVES